MKKVWTLLAAVWLCAGIQAQIVSSRSVSIQSTPTVPSETQWFLRGGLNIMTFAGEGTKDINSKAGYHFTYGFQKPMGSIGAYWGMDFGLGSRGYQVKEKQYDYEASLIAHNIQVSPFTFGWKYGITDQNRRSYRGLRKFRLHR